MVKNNIYPREISAYAQLLTEVKKMLISVGDQTQFAPKCLHTTNDPKMLLIFEDLRERGYKVLSRDSLMSYDQALPVLEKLAKLHAVSAVLYEKNPSIMDLYIEGSISANPERQDFLIHYRNCARTLGMVAEKEWGSEWKHIAQKLNKLADKIVKQGCDVYTRDEKSFSVFNHNDLWMPNLLFKSSDAGAIEDVLFVDFQLSYFGCPGIDLNFFFYGSLDEATRVNSLNKLIRKYHEILSETLAKLNYPKKIPTLHDIHVQIFKSLFNAVIAALCEVPLLVVEQSDDLQMDILLAPTQQGEVFRYSLFSNPRYRSFIQKLLPHFDDFGLLD